MSRSKPSKTVSNHVPFAEGFEVGFCVKGCYLKKIKIKEKVWQQKPYFVVYLHFLKENNSKWITKFLSLKPKEFYEDEEAFYKAKVNLQSNLENLMSCYLSGAHMKKVVQDSKAYGLKGYVEEIEQALVDKEFWKKEVWIKTVPYNDGSVHVSKFAPFMTTENEKRWSLRYTSWEEEQFINYKTKNNEQK